MKHWVLAAALLTGCAGQAIDTSLDLAQAAKEIEQGCGIATGSLLHPMSSRVLELRPATSARPSYAQVSCVMKAIEHDQLERRGVRVILTGEEAAK
jgi:hypothetical protein